jgi:4-amino-4-deoxy-L-arabinose transferase-like glycosyltransferase
VSVQDIILPDGTERVACGGSVLNTQSHESTAGSDKKPNLTLQSSQPWVLLCIAVFFLIRNLPWHLDDYDQAKQAYVSYEIVEKGAVLYQHMPRGDVATKPPLAGWVSAGLHWVTGWEASWRLASLLPATVLLLLLWREGDRIIAGGGLLSIAAFALNLLTPRLATLVRTDMLLTMWIFLTGWIIYRRLLSGRPWSTKDRWLAFLFAAAGLMTKGPVVYAFLCPGMVAYWWLARRWKIEKNINPGWWALVIGPMILFLIWAVGGILTSREFYEQVVVKEFAGRFTVGENAVHTNQPVYYYLPHLLHKWMPWSFLIIAIPFLIRGRWQLRRNPPLLWLICWAVGGLVLMSLVPSKRVDRIFPVIPPLCLVFPYLVKVWSERGRRKEWLRPAMIAALSVSVIAAGSYSVYRVIEGYANDNGWLARFGREVRNYARENDLSYVVVKGAPEGTLLYARKPDYTGADDSVEALRTGKVDALLITRERLEKIEGAIAPYEVVMTAGEERKKDSAVLVRKLPADSQKN